MNDDYPEKLSDIHIELHGFTQEDVIQNRKAGMELVRQAAIKGNQICLQTMWLDAEARQMGINMDYDENLTDEDLL